MGFLDQIKSSTPPSNGLKSSTPSSGGFLDKIVTTPENSQPEAPQKGISLQEPSFGMAKSTQAVPTPTTPNITPVSVAKQIVQPVARSVGTVGITAGNLPFELAGKKGPFQETIPTDQSKVTSAVFGGEPIKTVQQRMEETKKALEPIVGKQTAGLFSATPVVASIALDLSGWGGGKSVKNFVPGEVPETFFKYLGKEKNVSSIEKTLLNIGMSTDYAKPLAIEFAKTKTSQEVKDVLLAFDEVLKAPKIAAEANIASDIRDLPLSLEQKNAIQAIREGVTTPDVLKVVKTIDPKVFETPTQSAKGGFLDQINKPENTTITPGNVPETKIPVRTGDSVAQDLKKMGSDGGVSDFLLDTVRKENYSTQKVKIADLIENDPGLKEYIDSTKGKIRRYKYSDVSLPPIVTSKGEVWDGYNRIAQAIKNGETEIDVLKGVSDQKIPLDLEQEAKKYKSAEEFIDSLKLTEQSNSNKSIQSLKKEIGIENFGGDGVFKLPEVKTNSDAISSWETKIKAGERPVIYVDGLYGRLVDGNNRLQAYKNLGYKKVPVVQNTQLTDIWNKANKPSQPKAPVYEGETDLTTKILKDLEGKSTVSKQYISDATNRGELKQSERDIIRQVLENEGDTVNVADFAKKVKAELLPLNRNNLQTPPEGYVRGQGAKYENISLPSELKGNVKNYFENIYSSPIKTSAGGIHFSDMTGIKSTGVDSYFGHTRVEDMADDITRRVIEVQSDLYQKGNLEKETDQFASLRGNESRASIGEKEMSKRISERQKEVAKLQQYNDPTAHFRMVREEIKKAAQDGKTRLLFPTGETAMKIEGLGQPQTFRIETGADNINYNPILTTDKLKVGLEIFQGYNNNWIITDVLGDGKFKAIPKRFEQQWKTGKTEFDPNFNSEAVKETFDISGKVDTSNPIYKFYEKDLGKYLTNKYSAKRITDSKGVSWYEVSISKANNGAVEAFNVKNRPLLNKDIYMSKDQIREILFKDIPKDDVKLIFTNELIEGVADGSFQVDKRLGNIIKLYEENGKVSLITALHESKHYFFSKLSPEVQKEAYDIAKKEMGPMYESILNRLYKDQYKGPQRTEMLLEEYIVDKWSKSDAAKGFGYKKSVYGKIFDAMDNLLKKLVTTYKKVKNNVDKFFKERGGSKGGYMNFGEEKPKKTPLGKSVGKITVGGKEIDVTKGGKMELPEFIALKKEALENSPFKSKDNRLLVDKEGRVRELGDIKSPKLIRKIEDRMAEAGISDPTEFAEGVEKYLKDKKELSILEKKAIEQAKTNQVPRNTQPLPVGQKSAPLGQSPVKKAPEVQSKPELSASEKKPTQPQVTSPDKEKNVLNKSLSNNVPLKSLEVKQEIAKLKRDIVSLESTGNFAEGQRAQVKKLVEENKLPLTKEGESLKKDSRGLPVALSKKQKEIVAKSPFKDVSPKRIPVIEGSYGEIKAIEKLASQAESYVHGTPLPEGTTFAQVLEKTVTPVQKKVNIIDTFFRTPDRVMNKIGFASEAKDLRNAMDNYWKELPKNLERISQWAKHVSQESNVRIFDYLDGQAVDLNSGEMKIALEVKEWLKEWAERLGLANDKRVSDYITRIFNDATPQEFDEELAKIIYDKIPGSVYNPFTLKRLGAKGYRRDTWKALEAYVKRGTRKVHMDPVLERIQEKTGTEVALSNIEKSQFLYIQKYINNINLRPSITDESVDNALKTFFTNPKISRALGQRPVAKITRFLRQVASRAMLGLNPGSALRNLSQGVNTYAVLGEKYTTIGYVNLFKRGALDELNEVGVLNAAFIQDKVLSATGKLLEKGDKVLYSLFDAAEKINRGAAYFGAKSKALAAGKTNEEAIDYAKNIVRKTQFSFDSIDTPVGMSGDIVKTLLQFQTYSTKQVEFLTELVQDKNYFGLLRYAVAGLAFVYTIGQAFGMKPEELVPTFRFGMPPSTKILKSIFDTIANTPDKYGNTKTLPARLKGLGSTALKTVVPAGTQINKTYQGLKAVKDGGSIDSAGRTQFKVGGTGLSNVRAGLFGKYANNEAQDYFNKVTPAERAYEDIVKSKNPAQAYSDLLKKDKDLAQKVLEVKKKKDLGITDKDEKLLNLGVKDGARAQEIVKNFNKLKTQSEKEALWNEYTKKKILTKEVAKQVVSQLAK